MDAETGRVALIRFTAPGGTPCVGSGLLINARAILTADHVAHGSDHQVACKRRTHEVAQVLRSGSPDVDLAILILKKPLADVISLRYARVDRDQVSQIRNCVAVGFPRWKRDGAVRKSAQVNGTIPTAEGLEQTANQGLLEGFLTLVGNREPAAPPTSPGQVTEAGTTSPWGGMSGAVVTADRWVIGVVRSVNLAAGSQSLTITPLTAIENMPDHQHARKFWNALGVQDPKNLPRLPAAQERELSRELARVRRGTWEVGGALAAGTVLGAGIVNHHHPSDPAPVSNTHTDHTTSGAFHIGSDKHSMEVSQHGLAPDHALPYEDVHSTDGASHADLELHDIGTSF